jgi:uncharacterized membrane protein HdeD (DUF308 family)
VGVVVGVIVLHKLAVSFVALAFVFGITRRRADVSSTTTARVNDSRVVI